MGMPGGGLGQYGWLDRVRACNRWWGDIVIQAVRGIALLVAAAAGVLAAGAAKANRDIGLCPELMAYADPNRDDYIETLDKVGAMAAIDKCTASAEVIEASRIFVLAFNSDATAVARAKALVAANPKSPLALYMRGYAMLNTAGNSYADIIADMDAAAALKPDWAPPLRTKGSALFSQRKYADAVPLLRQAITIYPVTPNTHNILAASLVELKQFDEALKEADLAISLGPANGSAYFNKGRALIGLKRLAEAEEPMRIAAERLPKAADVRYERAGLLAELGRPAKDSLADAAAAAELAPGNEPYLTRYAAILADTGDIEKALTYFGKAIALNPGKVMLHWGRGVTLFQVDKLKADSEDIVWAKAKGQTKLYDALRGLAAFNAGDYAGADDAFGKSIDAGNTQAFLFYMRGRARASLGQCETAIADYDRSIEMGGTAYEGYDMRGQCAFTLGRYPAALADFDRALKIVPGDADVTAHRASTLIKLNRKSDAIASMDALVARDSSGYARQMRGQILLLAGQPAKALADFDAVRVAEPNAYGVEANRADALEALGRRADAASAYRVIVDHEPQNANALNGVCWNMALTGDGKGAIPYCERALAIRPGDGNIVHSLARALEVSGDRTGAITQYRRALLLAPALQAAKDDLRRLGATP